MSFRDQIEGIETVLPDSGETVRIRSINMAAFLRSGRIPDYATPVVARMLEGKTDLTEKDDLEKWTGFYEVQDEICRHALVHPRVVDDPADADGKDTITLDMLTQTDKQMLSMVLQTPVRSLAKLFRRQARALELMDTSEALPGETVGDPANPAVGS